MYLQSYLQSVDDLLETITTKSKQILIRQPTNTLMRVCLHVGAALRSVNAQK